MTDLDKLAAACREAYDTFLIKTDPAYAGNVGLVPWEKCRTKEHWRAVAVAAMQHPVVPPVAMTSLAVALRSDPAYRQSWFDNLSTMAQDAGAPKSTADEQAIGFLWSTFAVNHSPY